MEYDRHGRPTWANDGMRAWVGSQVKGPQQQHASVPSAQATNSVTSPADLATAAASDKKTRLTRAFSKRWLLLAGLGLVIMVIAAIVVPRRFGNPWKTQGSGTTQNLYEVAFPDASPGWASGGPTLTTSDGGKSWVTSGSKIWGMSFIDVSRGWGLHGTGEALVIVATTNGGKDWTERGSQSIEFLPSALTFADEKHGWIVGLNGAILATRDGGVTWTSQTSGTTGWWDAPRYRCQHGR